MVSAELPIAHTLTNFGVFVFHGLLQDLVHLLSIT
jgi:hypothetical protein